MLESQVVDPVHYIQRIFSLGAVLLLGLVLLGSSSLPPGDRTERVRVFTRDIEFDYIGWTLEALGMKIAQSSLGTNRYLSEEDHQQIIRDYLDLVSQIQHTQAQISAIYADPTVSDSKETSQELVAELGRLFSQRDRIAPVAEGIMQDQISHVVGELDLSLGGQPIPPVLYHNTPLPYALIVSPREVIRQEADISLYPDFSVEAQVELEELVEARLDVSSLVVPIGGVGVYPTMVQETNNLDWLSEVVAHEWVHNFLSLRPLGINYFTSPELRVMNETAASIAGKEIGRAVLEKFYPELVPPPAPPAPELEAPPAEPLQPPPFDFRSEMHETRLKVDRMLEERDIEGAEAYMEQRRKFFWDHGYQLRKLNQAYFAFYGAYADEPGGAAGATEDPVGEAVRALRAQSPDLATFLNRISWMTTLDQLQKAVGAESG